MLKLSVPRVVVVDLSQTDRRASATDANSRSTRTTAAVTVATGSHGRPRRRRLRWDTGSGDIARSALQKKLLLASPATRAGGGRVVAAACSFLCLFNCSGWGWVSVSE